MKQWSASFGASLTIEDTTLAAFAGWIEEKAKEGKGRGAQLKHGHLMTIARWCRARGMIESIPFEHAPKPEARVERRKPAPVNLFFKYLQILPPHMQSMWKMLGLTGMRISAACTLNEDDITDTEFTVTTKGDNRITYTIAPELASVIEEAREFKRQGVWKGRGKARRREPVENKYLFVNSRGVRWNKATFNAQLQSIRTDAGLDKITSHQLRHLAGTVMAEKNLSPDIIQAGLGHQSRESAESYIDQTRTMRDKALAVVADSLQIFTPKFADSPETQANHNESNITAKTRITCPCCGHNFLINKE